MRLRRRMLGVLLALASAQGAAAATIWDEGVNGDLSSDRANPTPLALALGSNTIIGSVNGPERDYFRFNLPAGTSLTQIHLVSYAPDDVGFLAIQTGTQITVDPSAPSPAPLLGWVHTAQSQVGSDILDDMGHGGGAIGFTPPLGPGDYSFWMQQAGAVTTSYELELVVVPEPASAALLAVGLGALALARRRV